MKRVVFDLDGTLLTGTGGFEFEYEYFSSVFGEDGIVFADNVGKYLDEFEKTFKGYRHEELSRFLSKKSGQHVTDKIIDGWLDAMSRVPDTMEDGVIQTLENLKRKDISLAVLTNWYGEIQIPRLRKAGILHYFDNIYTGNFVLKPQERAYLWAKDDFDIEECLFVGDNLDKDYIGPRKFGFDSIIYDKNNEHHKSLKKIKKINELIRISENE